MTPMSPVEAIFFAALEKTTPQERSAYLAQACGDDANLRDRVERLLAAHPQVGNFLEQPAAEPADTASAFPSDANPPGPPMPANGSVLKALAGNIGGVPCVHLREPEGEPLRPVVRTGSAELMPPSEMKAQDSEDLLQRPAAPTLPPCEGEAPTMLPAPEAEGTGTTNLPAGEPREAAPFVQSPLPDVPGYEILSVLGRGGMGVVYKARQLKLNRLVALKMILAREHAGPEHRERFRLEGEAVARLQHPHIVQIYEVGEHNGLPYFSLEYVDGGSLAQAIRGAPQKARMAAELVEELAGAIQAAHEQDIVHRDLKPANVLLTSEDVPKITDFGLAKRLDSDTGQTRSGAILGTPSYMAPEQAAGKTRQIGPGADIYALGAILYELLTGRPPFRAETPLDTVLQVLSEEPVSPSRLRPELPRDLETICMKCLRKAPQDRYHSARALAADLRRYLNHEPIRARRAGVWERTWRAARRRPFVVITVTVIVLAATLGIVDVVRMQSMLGQIPKASDLFPQKPPSQGDLGPKQPLPLLAQPPPLLVSDVPRVLCQSTGRVGGLALSPDGQTLATAGADLTISIWDINTGRLLQRLPGHRDEVTSLAFDPKQNRFLASASWDGVVKLWDTQTGLEVRTFTGPGRRVNCVAFSPDGRRLATAGADKSVTIWDADKGEVIHTLFGHDDEVTFVAYRPDGLQLASAGWDGAVKLWDPSSGFESKTPPLGARRLNCLAYSANGQYLAAAGVDSDLMVWRLNQTQVRRLTRPLAAVHGLAFSPDSRFLAVAGADKQISLWDVKTQTLLKTLGGHQDNITCVVFSPDGKHLFSAGWDKTVRIWDLSVAASAPTERQAMPAAGESARLPSTNK
jgi:eukaryotic-like serine/threonine-protein kinase